MTIDPKDLRTLLLRVTLVTLAVRIVPLLSNDLGPTEAAAAMGLGVDGLSAEWTAILARGWLHASGGLGLVARLPALLCDLALPVLAVLFARAAGWGAICGLLAGLVLAIAPLGVEAGHRLDGGAAWALIALTALVFLRRGLQDGDTRRVLLSAGLLFVGGLFASPLLVVVPAGLYLAARTISVGPHKTAALAGWLAAPLLALALRYVTMGYLVPEADAAARWLVLPNQAGEPSGWSTVGAMPALLQGVLAVLPSGPRGQLAAQLGILPAPVWAIAVGSALTLLALAGFVRGQVRADPAAAPPVEKTPLRSPFAVVEPPDERNGAGQADGWRTLGVALPTTARDLGDRDIIPLLLGILGAAIYVAQAGARGVPDGLQPALAVGRVCAALLLGVGLTALAMPRRAATESENVVRRRHFNFGLGAVALVIFGLGAAHLMAVARSPDRIAARKVAQRARETLHDKGALLALGPRGVPVAFLLDPLGDWPLVRVSALDFPHAISNLTFLLTKHPKSLVMAGDRDVLVDPGADNRPDGELVALGKTLDESLQLSGFHPLVDLAGVLGGTAIVRYSRESPSLSPETIRPQLGPGLVP